MEQQNQQVDLLEVVEIEEVEESREAFVQSTPISYLSNSSILFGRLFSRETYAKRR